MAFTRNKTILIFLLVKDLGQNFEKYKVLLSIDCCDFFYGIIIKNYSYILNFCLFYALNNG